MEHFCFYRIYIESKKMPCAKQNIQMYTYKRRVHKYTANGRLFGEETW